MHEPPHWEQSMRRYTVVIGKTDGNYSANLPDPPCCVATADTVEAIEAEIRDAIRIHVEGRAADGLPLPAPTSIAACIEAQHCV